MNRTAILLFAAAATLILAASLLDGGTASATHVPIEEVAIDVDVTGNTATSLGPTEYCNAEPLEVGETIDVDVVVRGVPEWVPGSGEFADFGTEGIWGYGFDLYFDPAVLYIEKAHALEGPSLVWAQGGNGKYVVVDYGDGRREEDSSEVGTAVVPPVSQDEEPGHIRVDAVDLGANFESGDGILTRLTFRAVGSGVTNLQLADHDLTGRAFGVMDATLGQSGFYQLANISQAAIVVQSGMCPQSIPMLPPIVLGSPPPTNEPRSPAPTRTLPPITTPNSCQDVIAPVACAYPPTPSPAATSDNAPLSNAGGTGGTAAGVTVTPAALPRAGGAPKEDPGTALVALAFAAAGIITGAWVTALRRTGR